MHMSIYGDMNVIQSHTQCLLCLPDAQLLPEDLVRLYVLDNLNWTGKVGTNSEAASIDWPVT